MPRLRTSPPNRVRLQPPAEVPAVTMQCSAHPLRGDVFCLEPDNQQLQPVFFAGGFSPVRCHARQPASAHARIPEPSAFSFSLRRMSRSAAGIADVKGSESAIDAAAPSIHAGDVAADDSRRQ